MSSALFIRTIGGLCGGVIGTYLSGKIYDYIYNRPQQLFVPTHSYPLDFQKSKIIEAKSFEEILNIQLQEYIHTIDKYNYEYDNEYGNTITIINDKKMVK
jgi:hypothetical protein